MSGSLVKAKYFMQLSAFVAAISAVFVLFGPAKATFADPACVAGGAYVLFARGSGAPFNSNEATDFHLQVMHELIARGIPSNKITWAELGNLDGDYTVESGEYYAVDIGNVWNALPPIYGPSVDTGTDELVAHINERASRNDLNCRKEAVIIGGYSQGADVIGWALQRSTGTPDDPAFTPQARELITYAALYGDPKLDAGTIDGRLINQKPWWVRGNNPGIEYTSPPRLREGILSERNPYVPSDMYGRFGSWCDVSDGICGAYSLFNLGSHTTAYSGVGWIHNSAPEIADSVMARRLEFYPESTTNTRIGVVSGGALLVKDGSLTAPWVTEYNAGVSSAVIAQNRIGIIVNGALYVKSGALDAPWVDQGLANVTSFAMSNNRIAAISGTTAYIKEGTLRMPWTLLYSGASSVSLSGNRIGVLTTGGTFKVKDGNISAGWVDEYGGVTQGVLSGNRIGVVSGGNALVKEGALDAGWVTEMSGGVTQQINLSGNRIGIIAWGNYYVKEGSLYAGWVTEYGPVSQAALSGNRIGVLSGGTWFVKEGTIYAGWVTEYGLVTQGLLN
jgi:hypothetical protein